MSEKSHEQIIFGLLREVDDSVADDIYWHDGLGRDGIAKKIWPKHPRVSNLCQWLVTGEDGLIRDMWQILVQENKLEISFKGKTDVIRKEFRLPIGKPLKQVEDSKSEKSNGPKPCTSDKSKAFFTIEDWDTEIGRRIDPLMDEDNCLLLQGHEVPHQLSPEDKPSIIYPPGLLDKGELYEMFKQKIVLIHEGRVRFSTLRGRREGLKEDEDPSEFVGFVQDNDNFRSSVKVRLTDLEDRPMGEAKVDSKSGVWKLRTAFSASEGKINLENETTRELMCSSEFHLIKRINVQTHMISGRIKDMYGREHNLPPSQAGEEAPHQHPKTIIWHSDVFSSSDVAELSLSDDMLDLFKYMGPMIVVSDPYALGGIRVENDLVRTTSVNQRPFLNAMLLATKFGWLKEITIIGTKSLMKRDVGSDEIKIVQVYRMLSKEVERMGIEKVTLCFSEKPFHDRHWLALRKSGTEELWRVSTSISGLLSSGEVSIIPDQSPEAQRTITRLIERLEHSKKYKLYEREA
ncbi:MAG TPA: hypothetical protein VLX91_05775 [Candidatus Acidoferrales bacterium]|nr:hypothetical protein [Candidatus Acidoferrales bacterium]